MKDIFAQHAVPEVHTTRLRILLKTLENLVNNEIQQNTLMNNIYGNKTLGADWLKS